MIVYCVLCACVFVCFCRQRLTASVKKVTKDARSSDPETESDQGENDTEGTKEQLRNGDHESRAPSPYFHTRARTHTHTHTHTHAQHIFNRWKCCGRWANANVSLGDRNLIVKTNIRDRYFE